MCGFEHKFFNVALRFHWVARPLECSNVTVILIITLSLLWAPHVSLSALSLALYALSVLYEQGLSLLLGALNPLI